MMPGSFELSLLSKYFSANSPQPMLAVVGSAYKVSYVNAAFAILIGKEASELIGRPFAEIAPEGNANGCLPLLGRVYQTKMPEILSEQKHDQGKLSYWTYSMWPILGEKNLEAGVMIQVTDVTEAAVYRKQVTAMNQALTLSAMKQHLLTEKAENLNTQLQSLTLAKSQFLASMSHEIRTPLSAVMGFAELLSQPDITFEDRCNYGGRIRRNSILLMRLIDDILDLSKIEAGKLEIEKVETNFKELFSDVSMVMRHVAEEKGLSFSMTASKGLPETVFCDPTRIKQILTNVIGNAVKFTATGSVSVAVEVDHVKKKLHVTVSDTGEGICPTQASKLFQPFSQADVSTTRRFGGTGLGLDLSRRLARALGGDIELIKSTLGVGSVFAIIIGLEGIRFGVLPLAQVKPKADDELRLDHLRILLAEDAIDTQFLVTTFLNLAGATVDVASDGEEAVAMALSAHYDVILMDMQMPRLDGYGATAQLRQMGYGRPIIALSAHAMRTEIDRCKDVGCNDYLSKPVSRKELIGAVLHTNWGHPTVPIQKGQSGVPLQVSSSLSKEPVHP